MGGMPASVRYGAMAQAGGYEEPNQWISPAADVKNVAVFPGQQRQGIRGESPVIARVFMYWIYEASCLQGNALRLQDAKKFIDH